MNDNRNETIVAHNVTCYNKRDIEGFMADFHPEISVINFARTTPSLKGLNAVRQYYSKLFKTSPHLHSEIKNRIVSKNKVIDHEHITGREGNAEMMELVLIYEIKSSKIFKITVIK